MLLRHDGDAVICIPQPSHAWLSGQMARAWGNDRFAPPCPREEVCLAAELHDIGWFDWELSPRLHTETGRPKSFGEVAPTVHVDLWRDGVRRARLFSRYAALLVSLHADTIYSRFFDFHTASPKNAAAVRTFLDEQHGFQRAMATSLGRDAAEIERNRLLIATLDWMSLQICWGVGAEVRMGKVPVGGLELTEIALRPADGSIAVDPWPFEAASLEVMAEGRRLHGRFTDEALMRTALDEAEPVLVATRLVPA